MLIDEFQQIHQRFFDYDHKHVSVLLSLISTMDSFAGDELFSYQHTD